MSAGYHQLVLGWVEVFHNPDDYPLEGDEDQGEGWYWWSCSPGCLPDGEAVGRFDTTAEALADARDDDYA